jgi:hypothetical protein
MYFFIPPLIFSIKILVPPFCFFFNIIIRNLKTKMSQTIFSFLKLIFLFLPSFILCIPDVSDEISLIIKIFHYMEKFGY